MERKPYQRPELFIADVRVERGFAATLESEVDGFDREVWDE